MVCVWWLAQPSRLQKPDICEPVAVAHIDQDPALNHFRHGKLQNSDVWLLNVH
jgi:hypothetical protein